MPKHTITQEPTDDLIPGASKAWMSHFSPSSNGRIIRVRLNDNNYLAYHPELLCRLTVWHNLHGGACQHGNSDSRYSRWPCAACRGWATQNSDRAVNKALDNPNRKIAMVPGPAWRDPNETEKDWYWPVASTSGYPKSKMGKRDEEKVARGRPDENFPEEQQTEAPQEKVYKKKRTPPGKKIVSKDLNHLRFAHYNLPGKDDPVQNGRDIAFSGDVLPSDGGWQRSVGSGSGVTLGTAEEKELADLRKQGLLKENSVDEAALTLESIVRDDQPVYTLRLVQKKKRKGTKGKGLSSAAQLSGEDSEQQAIGTNDTTDEKSGGVAPDALELLSQEAIEAMPEHCWTEFLADMEAEGWVPVVDDDLASVAESWVVMESESEDSDEKT